MQTFQEQIAATRANLERLEALAAKHPELFEHGHLIEVTPEHNRIYIHVSRDPQRDWKAFAAKYPANWRKKRSPSLDYQGFDYDGAISETEIAILGAEPDDKESQPLFAGEASAA